MQLQLVEDQFKKMMRKRGKMTQEIEEFIQCVRLAILMCLLVMIILGLTMPELCMAEGFGSERKVSLFFDDGWENQYDVAFPILKELGFKASFSIITDFIGSDRGTSSSRMNVSEIKELQAYGMDIACHTKTHPHMINLTQDQLQAEIMFSKNVLTQMGFNVKTFVYPFGEWNFTIIDYVKKAGYVCAREAKPEACSLKDPDPNARYHICSWQITNQSLNNFKQILSHSTESEVVMLTYHYISDEKLPETSTPVQNFSEQMKYLKDNNFKVVVLPELFEINEKPLLMLPHFIAMILVIELAIISIGFYFHKRKAEKHISQRYDKKFQSVQFLKQRRV
jgi:peptidoglycan/xylan/chitin deacetylase (PgdA/CDA1 family)